MDENRQTGIDIAAEVARNIYSNVKFEQREVQPIFVLHRDTVRNFLHEKLQTFEQKGKLLGLAGIQISLLASLFTATFNDWRGIKGGVIEGAFLVSAIICTYYLVKEALAWFRHQRLLTVDALADDLGSRGSVIKPAPSTDG